MNPLRAHMKAMHPRVKLPRSDADAARVHAFQHHHYGASLKHYHAGPNTGPGDRPAGWTTGEDAVLRVGR